MAWTAKDEAEWHRKEDRRDRASALREAILGMAMRYAQSLAAYASSTTERDRRANLRQFQALLRLTAALRDFATKEA